MRTTIWTLAFAVVASSLILAADFPRWRGADSNGSAGEPREPLVRSWDEARVAWVSETRSPHPWNYSVVRGRTQWPRTVLGNGGYCMPAVAGGSVYVGFWRPTGTVEAATGDGTDVTGTYTGTHDLRSPRKGMIAGTYAAANP